VSRSRGSARVGCSGWSYREWKGPVYDPERPARTWFAQYAERFDTVELNNSFYRLPDASTVDGWREQAPAGFVYAAKVGQFGTHRKKLKDATSWMPRHHERIERLADHLGPNLFQLPPRWKRNVERLDEALSAADPRWRWAVEVRDPSWLHDDVFEVLRRHRAALCLHDLLEGHPMVRTTDWTYLRFHGPDAVRHPYQGRYGPSRLGPVAEVIGGWLDDGCDVYAYFNNDWHANAVLDATWLRAELGAPSRRGSGVSGPVR
jgi:uncharacterized protein YecE (DUF72 family)